MSTPSSPLFLSPRHRLYQNSELIINPSSFLLGMASALTRLWTYSPRVDRLPHMLTWSRGRTSDAGQCPLGAGAVRRGQLEYHPLWTPGIPATSSLSAWPHVHGSRVTRGPLRIQSAGPKDLTKRPHSHAQTRRWELWIPCGSRDSCWPAHICLNHPGRCLQGRCSHLQG